MFDVLDWCIIFLPNKVAFSVFQILYFEKGGGHGFNRKCYTCAGLLPGMLTNSDVKSSKFYGMISCKL